ncbi:MAG: aminotransferase class V-fold PLP-dependent enzyme [Pirellulaceae bacterium]|nr:aminotransferase class V-fold PLP-dependent enzyme [Pirellulaceae bacterium]
MQPARIYLDHAATTWPKPEAVYAEMDRHARQVGAAAGRGAYAEAMEGERLVRRCRANIAALLGESEPERIVFTQNGTDSLNLAIHGLLRPGDHVVTTVCEHNSVLRPLRFHQQKRDVRVTYVRCDGEGFVNPDDIVAAILPGTRLIAMLHASNVTGAIQPAEEVGRIAAEREIPFLLDAAQSLGHLPISAKALHQPLIAAPGHKGLLGPLGTGILYVPPGMEDRLVSFRQGGTGTRSDEDLQPTSLPDKFESGNLNVPAIVGLGEGVRAIAAGDLVVSLEKEQQLCSRLLHGLLEIPGLTLHGPKVTDRRLGVVSFNLAGFEPQELAALLDSAYHIQVRAGIHCAPRMHAALGTSPRGTVRTSVSPHSTTDAEIDATVAALREVAAG